VAVIAPQAPRRPAAHLGVIDDARRHQRRRRLRTNVALVALGGALGLVAGSLGSGQGAGGAGAGVSSATAIRFAADAPTGYTVTFRYRDPDAASVRIMGEWYFSGPAQTTAWTSQGLLPAQWKPGDFPIAWPNGPYEGWPAISMKKDPATGIWSYTTPLPSGLYDYRFLIDCSATALADPSSTACGVPTPTREVYVPPDPALHTGNYSWEAPTFPQGKLEDLGSALMIGRRALAGVSLVSVYTPPGYEPRRSTPYPTLYVIGGLDTGEVTADANAGTANILDNLIDKHLMAPTVVVFTNFVFSGCPAGGWRGYDAALVDGVIPTIESRYDVSTRPAHRAVAGLSCGATVAESLLVNDTGAFRTFGLIAPLSSLPLPRDRIAPIKRLQLTVGGGLQDPSLRYAANDLTQLRRTGATVAADFVDGGHESYVWRVVLHDFLTSLDRRAHDG